MGEVVNLNRFRKARSKQDAAARAAENRLRAGQTKALRSKVLKDAEKAESELDSKRLD
jgi:hypothetical protein